MKMKLYHIISVLIFLITLNARAQTSDLSSVLNRLYDRILFTVSDEVKNSLNDSIQLIISEYAASESVFEKKLPGIRFLGQVTSSDSRIKILTWNLILRDGTNKYFCYLIRKGNRGEENIIHFLKGEHKTDPPLTDRQYSVSDWYGALYYDIKPCRKDYILLGFDFSETESRKIIDVLSFTDEGKIVLGKDYFIRENKRQFREVIEYSPESVVTLRFSSPKLIVFDQLGTFSSGDEYGSPSMGADGISFDGYIFKKGEWLFASGIDARNPRKQ
jgi:hypothetical protein